MTNEELAQIVRDQADKVALGGQVAAEKAAGVFLSLGITENVYVGWHKELAEDTPEAERMRLEWFAGQFINLVNDKAYFAINSWLNLVDIYTTPKDRQGAT